LTLLFQIGFLSFDLVDAIDIFFVTVLLYQVYKLMRGSVAVRVFLGFLFLYLIFLVVRAAEMELLTAILGQFMGVGVIAVIILFQPEIRKFLLIIGKSTSLRKENLFKRFPWRKNEKEMELNITPIMEAAKTLGASMTGALIVFSKFSELKFYADSGDRIGAIISKRLLLSIFNKQSPLHDGAVIIYSGKIVAARCILPVSDHDDLPAQFGLRHRAAVGMSEATDTLVFVVSEETGQFSIVRGGKIYHNISIQEARNMINNYFKEEEVKDKELEEMIKEDSIVKEGEESSNL